MRLADSSRFELIDGEVVPLSPPFIPHGWVKAELGFALRMRVDRALSILQEVSLQPLVEPDIVLCRLHGLPRRYLLASEVELVIEIADASARTDRLVKPGLYAQASIPHLSVVDLTSQTTVVHRQPADGGYQAIREVPFSENLDLPMDTAVRSGHFVIADYLPERK